MTKATENTNTLADTKSRSFGLAFLIAVCVGLMFGGLQLWQWMMDEQKTPIQQIQVTGNIKYIDEAVLTALIRAQNKASFLH